MEAYLVYLCYIEQKLQNFFLSQKPYIFCKEGCSKCCKNAKYLYSKMEFDFLNVGIMTLPQELQNKIFSNIKKIKKERKNSDDTYVCPFLIDEKCTVYNHRGLVCRSFGLMQIGNNGKFNVPFCAYEGLNYSNVLDLEKNNISIEKFKALNTDIEPKSFNVGYLNLVDEDIAKGFGFEFGEIKPLVDWF